MAKTARVAQAARAVAASNTMKAREPQSLERAISLCPHLKLMENIADTFILTGITRDNASELATVLRNATRERVAAEGNELAGFLTEKALPISLQRIVASYVSNAVGAGTYYQARVTIMRDINTKLANEHRDEDREGPSGFESKADEARQFAAEMAVQAFIQMVKAEGAVAAYSDILGTEWKAYEPAQQRTVSQKSAAQQTAAFEG